MFFLNQVHPAKFNQNFLRELFFLLLSLCQRPYRTKVNATMCQFKRHWVQWFCDIFNSSGIDDRQKILAADLQFQLINVNRLLNEAILT